MVYQRFVRKYEQINASLSKKQFLVPYLMSSHPGSTLKEAIELAVYLKGLGYMPEQVQDFYPTPSTLSTVMYATGIDPRCGEKVYVCRNPHEKAMQRALIQYRNPKNYDLVLEALQKGQREDLIGYGRECLIRPRTAHGKDGDQKKKEAVSRSAAAKGADRKPQKKRTIRNIHKKK